MTSPANPTSLPEDTANAIQDALSADHAALWVYQLVSAFLPNDFDRAVAECANAHRERRDATELLLSGAGQNPRSAESAYPPPEPVTDRTSAIAVIVLAETDTTVAWRAVLERTDDRALRSMALTALTDAAVRATRWRLAGGQTPAAPPLPGKPSA